MKNLIIIVSLVLSLIAVPAIADVMYVIDGDKLVEIEYDLETIDKGGVTVLSVTDIPGEIHLTNTISVEKEFEIPGEVHLL